MFSFNLWQDRFSYGLPNPHSVEITLTTYAARYLPLELQVLIPKPILLSMARVPWAVPSRRFELYHILTVPTDFSNIRTFRFDIPLVLKTSDRTVSTEAAALNFIATIGQQQGRDFQVPRLIDSHVSNENSYTLMTKIPGELLINAWKDMSDEQMRGVVEEIRQVVDGLWEVPQPQTFSGQVMRSTTGHGIRDPSFFFEYMSGPYESTLQCYAGLTGHGRHSRTALESFKAETDPSIQTALSDDTIVWTHSDLRMYNVLVHDGRLSGIVDWEDAAKLTTP